MKINDLNLQAFGHFTDFRLFFDENKNFHILYGPNEAGKSTILRSISNFLYGFPNQTSDSFLHSNSKLRIEGQLQRADGEKLQFVRRKGKTNTVLDTSNNPLDEKKVLQFLNGISEQQFKNMFALNHVSLREGGESLLQADGNVGQSLFSAASGINALRNVLDELESKSGSLFAKNKQRKTIMKTALQEQEAIEKKIIDNQMKIQDWKDLEREYNDGIQRMEELKKEINQLRIKEGKYSRLKQTLPKIAQRKEWMERLEELSSVPELPEKIGELRQANLNKLETAKVNLKKAEEELQKIKGKLVNIEIPDGLLEQAASIESLYSKIDSYKNDVNKLPRLQEKLQQLEQAIIAMLKDLGDTAESTAAAEKYRISLEVKKTILELANQKPVLENEGKNASKDYETLEQERIDIQENLKGLNEVADVESLEAAIEKIKMEGRLEKTVIEKHDEFLQIEQMMTDLVQNLPLFNGTSEELLELKVPNLTETVKKFQREYEEISADIRQLTDKIEDQTTLIEGNENRIRELESEADIPTAADLDQSRNHRDAGWLVIRQKLNIGEFNESELAEFSKGLPIDFAYEKSVKEADDISDKMRTEAEKVGQKNKLLADIETSKNKINKLASDLEQADQRMTDWNAKWIEYWQFANFVPLTPEEMLEWLGKYETFLELNRTKQALDLQIKTLENKITEFSSLLEGKLAAIEPVAAFPTLEDLIETAERTAKRLSAEKNKRENLLDALKKQEEKLKNAKEKKEKAAGEWENWKLSWKKAIEKLPVSTDALPTVVKDLLDLYEKCVKNYDELKLTVKEGDLVKDRIAAFENGVKSLEQTIVPDLIPNAMDLAVNDLFETVKKANKDLGDKANLQEQLSKEEMNKKEAEGQILDANSALRELLEIARCTSVEELEKAESAFKEKCDLRSKMKQAEEDLIAMGDGRGLDELLAEASLVNMDSLQLELEEIQQEIKTLEDDRSKVIEAHGAVKDKYLEKIEGTNIESVKAAEERQSKLAAIANYADEYITYRLASLLLQKGIDFYRENNQSPILNRASEIFRRLTLGSFDGITVEYDKKDQPVIMGVRNKEYVEISGMSDGTTDQLYLSLRIASIEKYVKENEPLPFIVDDILVHFDDERSKETLKVLLELSEQTQIIFFSHHYWIIELMKEVASHGLYQLEEINAVTV
jgi:uncharacterized protein YhaN